MGSTKEDKVESEPEPILDYARKPWPDGRESADLFCGGCTEIVLQRIIEQARIEQLAR